MQATIAMLCTYAPSLNAAAWKNKIWYELELLALDHSELFVSNIAASECGWYATTHTKLNLSELLGLSNWYNILVSGQVLSLPVAQQIDT